MVLRSSKYSLAGMHGGAAAAHAVVVHEKFGFTLTLRSVESDMGEIWFYKTELMFYSWKSKK